MTNTSYYFHRKNLSIDTNPPGYPISTFTALGISAIMGLLFVVFLPVIGFALAGQALIQKILSITARPTLALTIPGPITGEVHLTGTPGQGNSERTDAEVDQILKEIQERRAQK